MTHFILAGNCNTHPRTPLLEKSWRIGDQEYYVKFGAGMFVCETLEEAIEILQNYNAYIAEQAAIRGITVDELETLTREELLKLWNPPKKEKLTKKKISSSDATAILRELGIDI